MSEYRKKYGWNFPVAIDYQTGKIKMADLKEDIKQSIFILLGTTQGERFIHGSYGCNLPQFIFEPITYELIRKIQQEVATAIMKWEKRIGDTEVDILNDISEDSRIVIHIKYTVLGTNEADQIYYTYGLN